MKRSCLLAALALAACAPPAGAGVPMQGIVMTRSGDLLDISMADAMVPGVTGFGYANLTPAPASIQFVRVDGERSAGAVAAALTRARHGWSVPGWFHPAGGPGPVAPDGSTEIATRLVEGSYWAADVADGPGGRPAYVSRRGLVGFSVEGEGERRPWPRPAARVTATDHRFEARGLRAGTRWVELVNDGAEPHQLTFARMARGVTLADVRRSLAARGGRPAAGLAHGPATAVLEGGTRQHVQVELRRGRYALLCRAADRRGGPPHAALGMVDEVTVR